MYRWITFGELPEEMREPFTYALIVSAWVALALALSIAGWELAETLR